MHGLNENEQTKEGVQVIALTHEQLQRIYEQAAAIGAKEALKVFEQERKKEYNKRADKRLRNTKLLLRNYHMLKQHAENSVFGRTQMEESALDVLESMMSIPRLRLSSSRASSRASPRTPSRTPSRRRRVYELG